MVDIAIIGAGINGCFLAHELARYNLKVMVLEKNNDVANEATMANSAIVHSGHDPKEGTLKAKLNLRGNELYEPICKELGVTFKRTSALVVATSEEEENTLDQLYEQSKKRNVPVTVMTGEEARAFEKNLSDSITKAIELPSTGIIYPWEVAIALMEEAIMNGVDLHLGEAVNHIEKVNEHFVIMTDKTKYEAKYVINAAGIYADSIYQMVSSRTDQFFTITPRKGEYFVLDKTKQPLVERIIYPVPSSKGKGVLVVPTTHGNILLGPNSDVIENKEGNNNTKVALDYVKQEISKTVKNVPMDQVIRTFAGLRPTGNTGDFVIEEANDVSGFINVACIESPGLASAPAIAEYVIEHILSRKDDVNLVEKDSFQKRKPMIRLAELSKEEKAQLVKENKTFGRVVCRCEQITEGEILDVIHRPLGATTVKGVKKRIRPGMGRCQGGFCEPLVVEILARELGITPLEVKLDNEGSTMLIAETKGEH